MRNRKLKEVYSKGQCSRERLLIPPALLSSREGGALTARRAAKVEDVHARRVE